MSFPEREAAWAVLGDGPLEHAWVEDLEERPDGFYWRFEPDVMSSVMHDLSSAHSQEWQSVTRRSFLDVK